MAFNRFAAGKKVYGQGSFAPTRGQLNPTGYIQREIKKRNQEAGGVSQVGKDGQSDTRSGLAQRALDRGPLNGGPRQGNGPRRSAPVAVAIGGRNGGPGRNAGDRNGSQIGSAPGFKPKTEAAVATPGTTGPGATPPAVNINPTGQLELPYNSEFANMALDAQMQFDAENQELAQAEQEQALAYQQSTRDLEQGYTEQQRGTLNNNGASGTLFSSTYGTGVNTDARNYTNMKNDLFSENELFKSGILGQRNAAQARLNALIQRATQGYADSLAADAGNLGFGVDEGAGPVAAGPAGPVHATYNPNLGWNDVAPGSVRNNNNRNRNRNNNNNNNHGPQWETAHAVGEKKNKKGKK